MKTPTKTEIAYLASWTDEQLQGLWNRIGEVPDNRVKSGLRKGQLTVRAIRRSDLYLAELRRRKSAAEARAESVRQDTLTLAERDMLTPGERAARQAVADRYNAKVDAENATLKQRLDAGETIVGEVDTRCGLVRCTLSRNGDSYFMKSPLSSAHHQLSTINTDDARLTAHWDGFLQNQRVAS